MLKDKFCHGSRRMVLLIGKWAIKMPTLRSFVGMIAGFRENQEERYWWCSESGAQKEWTHKHLARIIWGDRFGFILIMERCRVLADGSASEFEILQAITKISNQALKDKWLGDDLKFNNVGISPSGEAVLIDYGYFNGMRDCYLGCPNGFSFWRFFDRMSWLFLKHSGIVKAPQKIGLLEFKSVLTGQHLGRVRVDSLRLGDLSVSLGEILNTLMLARTVDELPSICRLMPRGKRASLRVAKMGKECPLGGVYVYFYPEVGGNLGHCFVERFAVQYLTAPVQEKNVHPWVGEWLTLTDDEMSFVVSTPVDYPAFADAISGNFDDILEAN